MQSSREDTTYYDGREPPFPDAKFSAAICIETLEHVREPKQLLAEIFRALEDGGDSSHFCSLVGKAAPYSIRLLPLYA